MRVVRRQIEISKLFVLICITASGTFEPVEVIHRGGNGRAYSQLVMSSLSSYIYEMHCAVCLRSSRSRKTHALLKPPLYGPTDTNNTPPTSELLLWLWDTAKDHSSLAALLVLLNGPEIYASLPKQNHCLICKQRKFLINDDHYFMLKYSVINLCNYHKLCGYCRSLECCPFNTTFRYGLSDV